MKILWVTNPIFPELSRAMGYATPVIGGWMYGLAKDLSQTEDISLTIATSRPNVKVQQLTINGIEYLLLNGQKVNTQYDSSLEVEWKKTIEKIQPDLVHIHGIEFAHGLALMNACPNLNYVISIQGLVSVISRYYAAGMSRKEIRKNITIFDYLKKSSILQEKRKFEIRGQKIEKKYLQLAKHIIGRTQWDHDHVMTTNTKTFYHFCNESLRDEFYTSPKWKLQTKKDYSIFLSQASYPIKGLHQVLHAVYLLKNQYPNIQLNIAGDDITRTSTLAEKLRQNGYGKYVKGLIKKYELQTNINFLGYLDSQAMAQEYLKSHIFICPSSIENSPNSLGEAQILGVPCISSYVGGVPDMINHGENGLLYRFEEIEMLAQRINELFTNDKLAIKLSEGGIKSAIKRHDRTVNMQRTLDIYKNIIYMKNN
ncbi:MULTISPECIES: glycosyltransferase family 4 protein [unclassified Arenibacter]|uniref:glycosyltransferase family 4 protein n=1 Tax=unclassified Arenibacter TaxID=2615047 RepID=UPI000E34E1E0|nr:MULTISPECIES: glycosyltransferase family 4 protein [unclassified Arenibacter]MCM4164783.1 glycosyl transferase family 1 [Arenibacter sp. A80]RFT55850.1 glycosyltransferase [Arenibacter sp. P308M17]